MTVMHVLTLVLTLSFLTRHATSQENVEILTQDSLVAGSAVNDVDNSVEHHEAVVGKLFKYFLPKEFVQDGSSQVKVVEVGMEQLPDWLELDQSTAALVGVPSLKHNDRHYKLQVQGQSATQGQGLVSIRVMQDNVRSGHRSALNTKEMRETFEAVKCAPGASVTRAAVVIDANAETMGPVDKAKVVEALGSRLGLPAGLLKLLPVEEGKPLLDAASALVSGVGDVEGAPQHPGVVLQWEVGCGNVRASHMPVLQRLETASSTKVKDTLGSSLGHRVVGWHVTNNRPPRTRRRTRHRKSSRKSRENVEEYSGFYENGTDIKSPIVDKEDEDESSGFFNTDQPIIVEQTTTTTSSAQPTTITTTATSTKTVMTRTASETTTTPTTATAAPTTTTTRRPGPTTTTTVETMHSTTSVPAGHNFPPWLNNPPPMRTYIMAGNYFEYKIKRDTFLDKEDGNTRKMHLMLTTDDDRDLHPVSWIALDTDRQLLYGLPTEKDIGKYNYKLTVKDSGGLMEACFLEMIVKAASLGENITHESEAKFNINYNVFMYDMKMRLDLARKLANAFGDPDPSNMAVTRIAEGSVVYAWTNKSLPLDPCPEKDINAMLEKMVDPETQEIQPTFLKSLEPYEVLDVSYKKMGSCGATSTKPPPGGGVVSRPSESSDNSVFVATVVPAVVIAVLLVVAGLVACYLYRRRRKGSHDLDPATQVRKGAPVIFADELDEAQDSSRTPLMLPEEKPPQPPPEYPRSSSGSLAATNSPPISHRGDLDRSGDDLYNRPPPFHSDSYTSPPNASGPPPPPPYAPIPP